MEHIGGFLFFMLLLCGYGFVLYVPKEVLLGCLGLLAVLGGYLIFRQLEEVVPSLLVRGSISLSAVINVGIVCRIIDKIEPDSPDPTTSKVAGFAQTPDSESP
jgi:hypothetical protein